MTSSRSLSVALWTGLPACGYPMPGAGAPGKLRTYGVPTEGQRHKVTEVVVISGTQRTRCRHRQEQAQCC